MSVAEQWISPGCTFGGDFEWAFVVSRQPMFRCLDRLVEYQGF
jgi:hypothetical protein